VCLNETYITGLSDRAPHIQLNQSKNLYLLIRTSSKACGNVELKQIPCELVIRRVEISGSPGGIVIEPHVAEGFTNT
jgi:hypothetical protein